MSLVHRVVRRESSIEKAVEAAIEDVADVADEHLSRCCRLWLPEGMAVTALEEQFGVHFAGDAHSSVWLALAAAAPIDLGKSEGRRWLHANTIAHCGYVSEALSEAAAVISVS